MILSLGSIDVYRCPVELEPNGVPLDRQVDSLRDELPTSALVAWNVRRK